MIIILILIIKKKNETEDICTRSDKRRYFLTKTGFYCKMSGYGGQNYDCIKL